MEHIQVKLEGCYSSQNIKIITFGIGNTIENAILNAIKEYRPILDSEIVKIEYRRVYLNSNNEVINIIPFENDLNKIKISELDSIISLIELTKIYYDRMEL